MVFEIYNITGETNNTSTLTLQEVQKKGRLNKSTGHNELITQEHYCIL